MLRFVLIDVNANKEYEYIKDGNKKTLTNASANVSFMFSHDLIDLSSAAYSFSFMVEGRKIVVRRSSSHDVTTDEVTLMADKRYKSVTRTISYTDNSPASVIEYALSYTANPMLPDGFSISDFQ